MLIFTTPAPTLNHRGVLLLLGLRERAVVDVFRRNLLGERVDELPTLPLVGGGAHAGDRALLGVRYYPGAPMIHLAAR